MSEITARLLNCSNGSEDSIEEFREELRHFGVESVESAEKGDSESILLIFDQIETALNQLEVFPKQPSTRIIAISCSTSLLAPETAWRLLSNGADDLCSLDDPGAAATRVATRIKRWREVDSILQSDLVRCNLVGKSKAWRDALLRIIEIARFSNATVLITGETGTGKELAARLIHALDPRAEKRDLVLLDCSTIVRELSGSEFYGHERGAFTGAVHGREGAFALADGGTLFLDEVGELPPRLQAELLRVIQEGSYKPVGGTTWRRTQFRLICATNADPAEAMESGALRADFYYRIAAWRCLLPPLRDRPEDIVPLAEHFIAQARSGETPVLLDESVKDFLRTRAYPGNVRELKQLVDRICNRYPNCGKIGLGDIPDDERPSHRASYWPDGKFSESVRRAVELGIPHKDITRAASHRAVQAAIFAENGDLNRAADRLGLTRRWVEALRREMLPGDPLESASPAEDGINSAGAS